MNTLIKIGDFAQLNNIPIQTLRYYESIELLLPAKVDKLTNYRYYDVMQSTIVDSIQFLKSFNFSLEEIKNILDQENTVDTLNEKVEQKYLELSAEKKSIEEKMRLIQSFKETNHIYQQKSQQKSFEVTILPKRDILTFPISKNIYEMDLLEYELHLRQFKQSLVAHHIPVYQFNRVGSIMAQENFRQEELDSRTMFIFCDKHLSHLENFTTLPRQQYAIHYCEAFEEETSEILVLKKMLEERNLQVAGDYICEVVYEIPHSNQLSRNMFIRMQVPVF
ncbi:MerR family transcriptional regulator [Vagococcus elongatus]|uniref:HTH merR-type domain-containing protein n=1 Tax=Vagococcus elongatus TaxID=180344 RepID=A0A430B4X7_9ENTE|nr:MerR family transcriptional regulator [Vagococcus elongatus]RSU15262.1 hypothetical protein CBF29_02710 [Vagococcus elongatus]